MAMRMKMLKRLRLPTNRRISDRYVPSQSPLKAYSVEGAYVGSKNCRGEDVAGNETGHTAGIASHCVRFGVRGRHARGGKI